MLTAAAWRVVDEADVVGAASLDDPLPRALSAAGVSVVAMPDSTAADLLARAAGAKVVWLCAEDGDEDLTRALAEVVVRRSETGAAGPEVEVLAGSFDPVGARLLDAVEVMDVLRRECPWDREQTHESLLPYLVEETYEVVEAVEAGPPEHLREELGDLLLQVLFHARIAADADDGFTVDDVAEGLVDKLVRRHPHVFAGAEVTGAAGVQASWEAIKRAERSRPSDGDATPLGVRAMRQRARHAMLAVRAAQARAATPDIESRR